MKSRPRIQLAFEHGALLGRVLDGTISDTKMEQLHFVNDVRTKEWRAPARMYRRVILDAKELQIDIDDQAARYEKLEIKQTAKIEPRFHQARALEVFKEKMGCGVISLPTGGGKTILAILALLSLRRSTLIIVPTIDLMHQWHDALSRYVDLPIGMLGGGMKRIEAITISTYDSAVLFIESIGNRFGFLVVDECHHLPAPQYQLIAEAAIAPFRLGLSATVDRADGGEKHVFNLLGPMIYEVRIGDLVENVLAPYDIKRIEVDLSSEERHEYDEARKIYLDFVKQAKVNFSSPTGWSDFVMRAARLPGGKGAMRSYRKQKRLAQAASGKTQEIWNILARHCDEQTIIFTDDNAFAYEIGRLFGLAVLTHQTKLAERKRFLDGFRQGEISVLVTSKVLNEGVDVPEASVAIVVSGSGGVREHVQRLGRILRNSPGKRACLYELVAKSTSEQYVNRRRRMHDAYQGSHIGSN